MVTTMVRRAAAVAATSLLLVAVGCGGGGDDDDQAATTTTGDEGSDASTTTVDEETTTTATEADAETTTTAAVAEPTTQATTAPTSSAPNTDEEPNIETDRASGEGCSPGGDALPNGWWFGEFDGPIAGGRAPFDLACFFVGDAAVEASTEDGADGDVPNDVYIRNVNSALRQVPVSESATAVCLASEGGAETESCSPTDVGAGPVWIRVNDGQIDRIQEQFFP